ncbi:MAG: tetratricopeptide repeat protein, partial [Bryobacteraceae bacterium]
SYPDVAAIHYRFGAFLLKNEPARGLAEIKRALELDPLHIPSLVTLALDCLNSGDYETARRYGQQAVQAAPGNYASHLMLGRAYLLESKSRELEVPPEKAAAPEKSAPAKKSGPPGKPQPRPTPLKDAVRELETAVKLEPDSLDAHYNLSAAYALAGRTADVARERAECERLKELARARTGL